MTFLGDEGRDVIIVRRLFTELHPPLIGPGTSIGNMYLGPLYYYMMAPALFLTAFSPVGPAVQIAILGVITVWFVWFAGREWFGKTAGLIAAGLYAISPTVIVFSRSSWNPNIMPFFALLSIYSIWKVWKEHKFKWLPILGISFAFAIQSHYLAILLIPTIAIFYLLTFRNLRLVKNSSLEIKNFLQKSLFGFLIFLGLMSPLLFFDIRHNWMNSQAIYKFFTVRQETVSIRPWNAIPKIPEILNLVSSSLLGGKNTMVASTVSILVFLSALVVLIKKERDNKNPAYLLITWIGFALIGLGLYKQQIYDHYFGFIFVVPFLLIGAYISSLFETKKTYLKYLGGFLVIGLVLISLNSNPLRFSPNKQLSRSVNVAKKIEEESGGKPFNLAVIAERNYEDGYKYFLLKDNFPITDINAQRPETITDQLFAVCELFPAEKCDPTHNPKAQVANFGWSKIDQKWEVDGAIIYRLVHLK